MEKEKGNIVKHKDGTYSILNLSKSELSIISYALNHYMFSLKIQEKRKENQEAHSTESFSFCDVLSNKIVSAIFR